MFQDAEKQLDSILKLVAKCPERLQEKCFEILLQAYVSSKKPLAAAAPPPPPGGTGTSATVPATLLPRFKALAKRLSVDEKTLEGLFDFATEPFTFNAYQIPGESAGVKARNVVLVVAAKSYLATGTWAADWNEVKLECMNQTCYDQSNHVSYLKRGEEYFKTVASSKPIELKAAGVKASEGILRSLLGLK
jgi:hypothetical protein